MTNPSTKAAHPPALDPATVGGDASPLTHRIDSARVPLLSTGHVGTAHAVVDRVDEPLVNQWTWSLHSDGYAFRRTESASGRSIVYMHRELLAPGRGLWVDHVDGDRLNNMRCNLRLATPSQNGANSASRPRRSGFRGVYPHKPTGRWLAQISIDGRVRHLGIFDLVEDAAMAYDHAARAQWGPFARTSGFA